MLLDRLASELQGPTWYLFPSTGITDMYLALLFTLVLEV